MTKTLLSRTRNTLVALSLVVSALSTGCAVGVDGPNDELAADEAAMLEDDLQWEARQRAALLQQLADDAQAGELSDRERVLAELLDRVQAGEPLDLPEQHVVDSLGHTDPGVEELEPVLPELPEGPVGF